MRARPRARLTVAAAGALALAAGVGVTAKVVSSRAARVAGSGALFDLSFTQELRSPRDAPKKVRVEGTWQAAPYRPKGSNVDATAYRLVDARVSTGAEGTPAEAAAARAFADAAARPFMVTSANGRAHQAWFSPDVSPAVRNLLLTVVAELPAERPKASSAPVVTTERDLYGRYLAAVQPDPDGRGFQRRKMRYVDLDVPDSRAGLRTAATVTIGASLWRSRFAADGRLERLDGDEDLRLDTGILGLAPQVRTEIHLQARGAFDAASLAETLNAAHEHLVSTALVTQQAQTDGGAAARAADERLVGGATLAELMRAFEPGPAAEPAAGGPLAKRHAAVQRLAAFVRLRPAAVAEIAARVRAAVANAPAQPGAAQEAQGLVQALGAANEPSALTALAALAGDAAVSSDVRLMAIRGLAQGNPDESRVTALEALIDDADAAVREAAVYGTGTLVAAWRKIDLAAAAPALERMVQRLDRAPDDARRILALRGLGNAADAVTVPVVQRALENPNPEVRGAAVQALRNVMAPGIDEAIINVMRHDSSPAVRAAALVAAGSRDAVTYAEAAGERALRDTDASVRSAAVTQLGRGLTKSPRAREVLARVAASDANPQISKRARSLLQASP